MPKQIHQKERKVALLLWALATKAEAQFGLGDLKGYKATCSMLKKLKHARWMMDSFETQINKLDGLLTTQRNLLYPWA